jgi:hypothetical protein
VCDNEEASCASTRPTNANGMQSVQVDSDAAVTLWHQRAGMRNGRQSQLNAEVTVCCIAGFESHMHMTPYSLPASNGGKHIKG